MTDSSGTSWGSDAHVPTAHVEARRRVPRLAVPGVVFGAIMSTPTAPTPSFQFTASCKCMTCNKELFAATCATEQDFKEASAKALTASELHDCKGSPKKA